MLYDVLAIQKSPAWVKVNGVLSEEKLNQIAVWEYQYIFFYYFRLYEVIINIFYFSIC